MGVIFFQKIQVELDCFQFFLMVRDLGAITLGIRTTLEGYLPGVIGLGLAWVPISPIGGKEALLRPLLLKELFNSRLQTHGLGNNPAS